MPRTHAIPPEHARHYLEPGPVVLLSTASMDERVILTQGGHMLLGYDLVGTFRDPGKHSDALVRRSRECVINLPAADLLDTLVRIGNCSGMNGDKSECFGLTAIDGSDGDASDLGECHARIGRVPALPRRRAVYGQRRRTLAPRVFQAGHARHVNLCEGRVTFVLPRSIRRACGQDSRSTCPEHRPRSVCLADCRARAAMRCSQAARRQRRRGHRCRCDDDRNGARRLEQPRIHAFIRMLDE